MAIEEGRGIQRYAIENDERHRKIVIKYLDTNGDTKKATVSYSRMIIFCLVGRAKPKDKKGVVVPDMVSLNPVCDLLLARARKMPANLLREFCVDFEKNQEDQQTLRAYFLNTGVLPNIFY
jgi:hypothetical protein